MYCILCRNLQHGGSEEKTLAFLQESYRVLHELHRSRKLGCAMIQSLFKSKEGDHLYEQPKICANNGCSRPIAKAWFELESTHLNKTQKTSFMECLSDFFASPKANPSQSLSVYPGSHTSYCQTSNALLRGLGL